MENQREHNPNRTLENTALFSSTFTASVLAEYVGDSLHNPDVTDVSQGAVIAMSLVLAGLATVVVDHIRNR